MFEDITITPDDYKMIAKAKTPQVVDLRKVKATDDGLKTGRAMRSSKASSWKGDDITDAGIKAVGRGARRSTT